MSWQLWLGKAVLGARGQFLIGQSVLGKAGKIWICEMSFDVADRAGNE